MSKSWEPTDIHEILFCPPHADDQLRRQIANYNTWKGKVVAKRLSLHRMAKKALRESLETTDPRSRNDWNEFWQKVTQQSKELSEQEADCDVYRGFLMSRIGG